MISKLLQFLAFSLEFQIFFSITRLIFSHSMVRTFLVTKYHFLFLFSLRWLIFKSLFSKKGNQNKSLNNPAYIFSKKKPSTKKARIRMLLQKRFPPNAQCTAQSKQITVAFIRLSLNNSKMNVGLLLPKQVSTCDVY